MAQESLWSSKYFIPKWRLKFSDQFSVKLQISLWVSRVPYFIFCASHFLTDESRSNYVVLVSGLAFGQPDLDPVPMQLFLEYVTGFLGGSEVSATLLAVESFSVPHLDLLTS